MTQRRPGRRRDTEHAHQVALMQWAQLNTGRFPELGLLFAIPNGGARNAVTGARLKAEGVRRGVPDLCLPVARGGYHGLFIELKAEKGTVSSDQHWWLIGLDAQGYRAVLCVGWEPAATELERYLRLGAHE